MTFHKNGKGKFLTEEVVKFVVHCRFDCFFISVDKQMRFSLPSNPKSRTFHCHNVQSSSSYGFSFGPCIDV